jgi:hypothetical protein
MKKSQTIKLVLIAGLTIPGITAKSTTPFKPVLLSFSDSSNAGNIYTIAPKSFNKVKDTSARSSGPGSFAHLGIIRGGWGFFGHHNSAVG